MSKPILSLCCAAYAAAAVGDAPADGGWGSYGGDPQGRRYSPLAQIHRANVDDLAVAWTFRTGELGDGLADWEDTAFEATPILHGRTLYLTTANTDVVAIDAVTGRLRWRADTETPRGLRYSDGVSRGVSLWIDRTAANAAACRARIYAPTRDGRLLALDADDGRPCSDFGEHGEIDLTRNVGARDDSRGRWRNYLVTSPPAVLGDKIIVGSSIGDNRFARSERGIVRAFDARSGDLLWAWDPIPGNGEAHGDEGADGRRITGAANAWAPLAVDAARNLVLVPTGSASPDYFGGLRPGDNRWANSVVALDGDTGELVWGRQLVHHDLWDYDVASQPTIVELARNGRRGPAVIQAAKTGFLYTFDLESGTPVFPLIERPVPQDAVPGERPARTQPFPAAPPPLVRQSAVTPDEAWGIAWLDERACRRQIEAAAPSAGIFQPPSTRETIVRPGNAGGSNWGGIAFDPERQIAIVNTNDLPYVVALVPRAELQAQLSDERYTDYELGAQRGTPYAVRRRPFVSPLGIPCVAPPWGTLTAIDMTSGTIRWRVPLGGAPFGGWNVGVPNIGGPIATGGGLVFIAATIDDRFRAFDIDTGELLWEVRLPAGGQATPMTYAIDGKQFVVIAAGGYKALTTRGDHVVAYALPETR